MLGSVLILLFCLVTGVLGLAVSAWVVFSGQLLTLDGLMLLFISLLLGGLLTLNFALALRSGEVRELRDRLRRRSTGTGASSGGSPS